MPARKLLRSEPTRILKKIPGWWDPLDTEAGRQLRLRDGPEARTGTTKGGGAADLLNSLSQKPPVPSSVGKGKRQSVAG